MDVLKNLEYVRNGLDNLQPSGDHIQVAAAYVDWLTEAERMLRDQFIGPDLVWPGLNTDRARQIAEHRLSTRALFDAEKHYQQARLSTVVAVLTTLHDELHMADGDEIAVPDTNYLLRGAPMVDVAWHDIFPTATTIHLMIMHVVIDELDDLSHQKVTKDLARAAIRIIDEMRAQAKSPVERVPVADGVTMQILADPPLHNRYPDNDAELMARAQLVHAVTGKAPTIITIDRGMIVRAHTHGLRTFRANSRPITPSP